jgi:hypothetical protein
MARRNKTDRELGWLRNVWEELAEAEMRHAAFAKVILQPTATRGMFTVRIEIDRPEVPNGFSAFKYHTMVRYPNSYNTEFLAWLWGRSEQFAAEAREHDEAVKGTLLD